MKKLLCGICFVLILAVVTAYGLRRASAVSLIRPTGGNTSFALTDQVSEKQMALESELIISGRCVDTRSLWMGRTLVTLATISVGEVIKGQPQETLTVVLPGGTDVSRKVPIAMNYEGAPHILPQEEVFLFLNHEPRVPPGYIVAGYSQGKFSIVEDEQGQKCVSRDLSKVQLRNNTGIGRGTVQKTSLGEFKDKIKGYLRQQ